MGAYIINIPSAVDRIIYVVVESDGKTEIATRSVSSLQPYTEPEPEEVTSDAYQQGYQQGYDEGKLTTEHEAYLKGLYDAWETAKKVTYVSKYGGYGDCLDKVFDRHDGDAWDVFDYSPTEAIEKIRQYEQEKEEQIQVGDEVSAPFGTAVVTRITDNKIFFCYAGGHGGFQYKKDAPLKTGRHFPEIAEVLQKMKES